VHIVSRSDGKRVAGFGRPGRMAGEFKTVHGIAIDSKSNLYTAEVGNGRRIQKFVRFTEGRRRRKRLSAARFLSSYDRCPSWRRARGNLHKFLTTGLQKVHREPAMVSPQNSG
jgi:hypothetical protein